MTQFVKKSAKVNAFRFPFRPGSGSPINKLYALRGQWHIDTKLGLRPIGHGDWVVVDENGLATIYSNERFEEKFEPVSLPVRGETEKQAIELVHRLLDAAAVQYMLRKGPKLDFAKDSLFGEASTFISKHAALDWPQEYYNLTGVRPTERKE